MVKGARQCFWITLPTGWECLKTAEVNQSLGIRDPVGKVSQKNTKNLKVLRWFLAQAVDRERLESLIQAIEGLTEHQFVDPNIVVQSLTHSSFSNELAAIRGRKVPPLENNERLEFLGDAVIGLIVAEILMEKFPTASEGKLSRWRSSLVSRKTLAEMARGLSLGSYLLLGRGEKRTGGEQKRSILAATLEAVVGALYLDAGMEKTTEFLERIFSPWFRSLSKGDDALLQTMDRKTYLQERTQYLFKTTPIYRVVDSWGPEHEKNFRVEILIDGKVVACGDGRSKKDAEQQAAFLALDVLQI